MCEVRNDERLLPHKVATAIRPQVPAAVQEAYEPYPLGPDHDLGAGRNVHGPRDASEANKSVRVVKIAAGMST